VANFGSVHEVVNHSKGFVNSKGGHTDQIENFWSHLKHDYRNRSGLNHNRTTKFLKEFSWRKRHCQYKKYFIPHAFALLLQKCLII
jgi:hypothetical protein